MKFSSLKTCALLMAALPLAASEDPASVLIIVNDSTPPETGTNGMAAGLWVAQHYADKRNIPYSNIVHISTPVYADPHSPTSYIVTWNDFVTYIRTPVKAFLESSRLITKIKYVVPTYGVPTHLQADATSSVSGLSIDGFLATMYAPNADSMRHPNPVYSNDAVIQRQHWTTAMLPWPMYSVARLDGPSAAIAAGLVDKAINAEHGISRTSGVGYFDFAHRTDPSDPYLPTDQTMLKAYQLCEAAGMNCSLNDQSITGTLITSATNTLWAWGWYSVYCTSAYSFAPGAVGAQLTSFTANDIRNVNPVKGTWVPLWLQAGITATWGATAEPYTNGYARGEILLMYLWNGYTFGEASAIANPSLNWMMMFVGDPLYSPVFTDSARPGLTLSGQIAIPGGALNRVVVSLSGSATALTTSSGFGGYSFSGVPAGGTYTVIPTLAGYSFSPPSQSFTALSGSNIANFTATPAPVSGGPSADSVAPAAGSALAQTFTFSVSDPRGSGLVTGAAMLIASTATTANACAVVYDRSVNTLSLLYDNPAGGASPVVPGSASVVSNSQCTLRARNSSVTAGVATIAITLDLTFAQTFAGSKNIYVYAGEAAANTGWIPRGTWTVPGGGPSADSVTPSSGTGAAQSFSFSVSDPRGAGYLTGAALLIAPALNASNACMLVYDRGAGTISLLYDNAVAGASPVVPGSSSVVSNSQCTLRGINTQVVIGATSVTITVNISFAGAFAGSKNLYVYAGEPAVNSGWVNRGSWIVP